MLIIRYLCVIMSIVCAALTVAGQSPVNGSPADADLRKAAQDGDVKTVKGLLAKGADVNTKDDTGKTALLWVAPARDNPEMVKLLIANGADVNAKDNEGETALMIAASQSNPGILTELIDAGADVNAQNNAGGTALMAAAFRANLVEIRILLAKDAAPKLKDRNDRTALEVAQEGSKNYHDETNRKRFAEAIKILEVPID